MANNFNRKPRLLELSNEKVQAAGFIDKPADASTAMPPQMTSIDALGKAPSKTETVINPITQSPSPEPYVPKTREPPEVAASAQERTKKSKLNRELGRFQVGLPDSIVEKVTLISIKRKVHRNRIIEMLLEQALKNIDI